MRSFHSGTSAKRILTGLVSATFLTACIIDGLLPTSPPINLKRIFVTSSMHTGDLGGLAGADSICGARATEAGLRGGWTAFLSDSLHAAADRITQPDIWLLVDGVTAAFPVDSGFSRGAITSIHDEHGNPVPGGWAWTGTLADGLPDTENNCDNWTSSGQDHFGAVGEPVLVPSDGSPRWMHVPGSLRCASQARLYCMERDEAVPPP